MSASPLSDFDRPDRSSIRSTIPVRVRIWRIILNTPMFVTT